MEGVALQEEAFLQERDLSDTDRVAPGHEAEADVVVRLLEEPASEPQQELDLAVVPVPGRTGRA